MRFKTRFSLKKFLFLASITLMLASCTDKETPNQEVIRLPNKTITVLNYLTPKRASSSNLNKLLPSDESFKIVADKIEDLEDGLFPAEMIGWYDENTLLIIKNSTKNFKIVEEQLLTDTDYTGTLCYYNLITKSERKIMDNVPVDGQTRLSPDKKHILFHQFENNKFICAVMDHDGANVKKLSDPQLSSSNGFWIDNETVLFSSDNGHVYTWDLSGRVKDLGKYISNPKTKYFSDIGKIGDQYYAVLSDNADWSYGPFLTLLNVSSRTYKLLGDVPRRIFPSPDNSNLAVIKSNMTKNKNSKRLVLEDIQGNELKSLIESGEIYWVNWLNDLKHLAFISASGDKFQNGIFIANLDTGKIQELPLDMDLNFIKIMFNKDTSKLYVAGFMPDTGNAAPGSIPMKQKIIHLK